MCLTSKQSGRHKSRKQAFRVAFGRSEGAKEFPLVRGWSIVLIRSYRDLEAKLTTPEALAAFIRS